MRVREVDRWLLVLVVHSALAYNAGPSAWKRTSVATEDATAAEAGGRRRDLPRWHPQARDYSAITR